MLFDYTIGGNYVIVYIDISEGKTILDSEDVAMLPIDVVSEEFPFEVFWDYDDETKTITGHSLATIRRL